MISYLFPVFLSLVPALHLYIHNRVPIRYAYPTWIALAVFALLLTLAVRGATRQAPKAGLIAGFFSIAFFYFELFLRQLDLIIFNLGLTESPNTLLFSQGLAVGLFVFWLVLWTAGARFALRSESTIQKVNSFLLIVSLILLVSPVISIAQILGNSRRIAASPNYSFADHVAGGSGGGFALPVGETGSQPDIFYLIFDGFAGEDILKSVYDLDISPFFAQLEERGFYLAVSSKTNYSQTINSLPSSLNMSYLDGLADAVVDPSNWGPLAQALRQNLVSTALDEYGYDLITFSSGFWPTDDIRSDRRYRQLFNLNEYQEVFLQNTPLVHLDPDLLYDQHRSRISYTLEHLAGAAHEGSPRFVFAHLYIPHPPFVFDREGNHVHVPRQFTKYDADGYLLKGGTTPEYQQMYKDQLSYIADRILILVDEILLEAEEPPVIIIQADHGPGSTITQHQLEQDNLEERFSILNAYYFPDQDYSALYPEITPVNSFRVVFDQYFGTALGLLPDRQYFSTVYQPYHYTDLTESLK